MDKTIILRLIFCLIILFFGCESSIDIGSLDMNKAKKEARPVCNKPYILVGHDCCLDKNDNSICDKEDTLTANIPKQKNFNIDDLKIVIRSNYATDKKISWLTQTQNNIIYHRMMSPIHGLFIVAFINASKDYIDSYQDFLLFNFTYMNNESNNKVLNNKSYWEKSYNKDKIFELPQGNLIQRSNYWYKDNKFYIHDALDIHCSSKLLVRYYPHTSISEMGKTYIFKGNFKNNEKNVLKTYENDFKLMLPIGYEILSQCPNRKKYGKFPNIYDIEKIINNALSTKNIFLKSKKGESIFFESFDSVATEMQNKNLPYQVANKEEYQKIIIQQLLSNSILIENKEQLIGLIEKNDFFKQNEFEINNFIDENKAPFLGRSGITMLSHNYVNHTSEETIISRGINIKENLVHSSKVGYIKFIFNFNATRVTDKRQVISPYSEREVDFIQDDIVISLPCTSKFIIHLFAKDFMKPKSTIFELENLKRFYTESVQNLIYKANLIQEECQKAVD